jgi:monofunctional biosynthetic peptidoglycan transglycosylase
MRRLWRGLRRAALWTSLVFVGASVLAVLLLRWIPPPTSSFILQTQLREAAAGRSPLAVEHEWVSWERISPPMRLAVVASEDQRFPVHHGFDVESIQKALDEAERGRRVRGASTISQQVAKNLFLWPGKTWLRKGIEAYFTVAIETLWPKRRILEVYLNVAQFGDATFGVESAAQRFFHKPAARLTPYEASLLATVLPNPHLMHPDRPSGYVARRAAWVRRQMRQLGAGYLGGL